MSTSKWGAIGAAWIIATLTGTAAQASVQPAGSSLVSAIQSYTEFGDSNGDVIVQLVSNSLAGICPAGFWIRGSDIGAKNTLTQILAAYHTGLPVVLTADTAVFWTGNPGSHSCLLYSLQS
jgi:hypothetical protein